MCTIQEPICRCLQRNHLTGCRIHLLLHIALNFAEDIQRVSLFQPFQYFVSDKLSILRPQKNVSYIFSKFNISTIINSFYPVYSAYSAFSPHYGCPSRVIFQQAQPVECSHCPIIMIIFQCSAFIFSALNIVAKHCSHQHKCFMYVSDQCSGNFTAYSENLC